MPRPESRQPQRAPKRRRPGGGTGGESSCGKPRPKAAEHHDAWLRAKAEADNIRKRTAVELANAYKYAIESSR